MQALKDIVKQVQLFCGLEVAMADLIEDHGDRLMLAESENEKRKKENEVLKTRLIQLEMVVGEMRRNSEGRA